MTHPINSVLVPGAANKVSKSYFADYVKSRNPFILSSSGEIQTLDLAGTDLVGLGDYFFAYDSTDTTTPHNGTTVLVDTGGRRYKQVTGMAAGTYDPQGIANDAFDVDNMVESATRKFANQTLGVPLPPFLVAGLPAASGSKDRIVSVVDEIGGPTPAFSDGLVWRRTSDRAVISGSYPGANMLLNLKNNVARVGGVNKTIDQVLTCTRASTATADFEDGSLKSFAANEIRLTDRGLLSFESRTNSVKSSHDLTDASWTKTTGVTVTANATAGPDGAINASKLVYDGTGASGSYRVYTTPITPSVNGQDYTFSIYLRADTSTTVRIAGNTVAGGYVTCNLTTDWQRFETSGVGDGTTSVQIIIYSPSGINDTFTIYAAYAQLEDATFAGPAVETAGAPVTVQKDDITFTDLTWTAPNGLFIIKANTSPDYDSHAAHYLVAQPTNSFLYGNAGNFDINAYDGSFGIIYDQLTDNTRFVAAVTVGAGEDTRMCVNGGLVKTTAGMSLDMPTSLYLGQGSSKTSQVNAFIEEVIFIPYEIGQISDADIQGYAT